MVVLPSLTGGLEGGGGPRTYFLTDGLSVRAARGALRLPESESPGRHDPVSPSLGLVLFRCGWEPERGSILACYAYQRPGAATFDESYIYGVCAGADRQFARSGGCLSRAC